MARLADSVANWLGRVELVARGADDERRAALRALEQGDPLQARQHALALLQRAPGSPIGLALLVEACEGAWLYDEALESLRQLCESAPWRGELWVRLGELLELTGADPADSARAYQNALDPETDAAVRRRALLKLADLDLKAGDPGRASRWLEPLRIVETEPDVALRRLELGLEWGDRALVQAALEALGDPAVLDGRAALACARARWMLGEPGVLDLLMRALILETPGVEQALASYVTNLHDVVHVSRIRLLLRETGREQQPAFALALALAEGRERDARDALETIARGGDRAAAHALCAIALERQDSSALRAASEALGAEAPAEIGPLLQAEQALEQHHEEQAMRWLDELAAAHDHAAAYAEALRVRIFERWLQDRGQQGWATVLGLMRRAAVALDRLDVAGRCEGLAIEQERPLRVAVVGEFNAGKSTFVNALLGADVAPTGVLPTTASLHWLSWAPDPFVRLVLSAGPDRIVSHQALKQALREMSESGLVREVHICAPIERLKRIEVLDTPGFNAPEADHIEAAQRALREAHVALWILDGSQALKDSEVRVLGKAAEVGTPVQMLVNKVDRFEAGQRQAVLEHVGAGLQQVQLQSMGPVIGFSARLALAGRLGQADAREQSNWDAVERMLSQVIVDRSEMLKRRALRRKALSLVVELETSFAGDLAALPGRVPMHDPAVRAEMAARVVALDRQAFDRMHEALAVPLQSLDEDLRPLRVAAVDKADAHAQAYVEARIAARLVDPVTQALMQQAGLEPQLREPVRQAVAMVLRGAAASGTSFDRASQVIEWRVLRACAWAVHEVVLAQPKQPWQQPAERAVHLARLRALRRALEGFRR